MRFGVISVLWCDAVPVAFTVHFGRGSCLGTVLSEVRVHSVGWLLVCMTLRLDLSCSVGGQSEEDVC
jgi:hypothetical protein